MPCSQRRRTGRRKNAIRIHVCFVFYYCVFSSAASWSMFGRFVVLRLRRATLLSPELTSAEQIMGAFIDRWSSILYFSSCGRSAERRIATTSHSELRLATASDASPQPPTRPCDRTAPKTRQHEIVFFTHLSSARTWQVANIAFCYNILKRCPYHIRGGYVDVQLLANLLGRVLAVLRF